MGSDQPRWPRGAPDDAEGHGQGGRWVDRLSAEIGGAGAAVGFSHGLMSEGEVASYLGRTDFEVFGQAGGANGSVEFRQYSDGTRLAYKTLLAKYRTPEEIDGEIENEVEASLVGRAMGVPVPAVVADPDNPRGLLMQYIDDAVGDDVGDRNTEWNRMLGWKGRGVPEGPVDPRAAMLGLLDMVVGNGDRHLGNVRFSPQGLVGVDHGSTFLSGKYRGGKATLLMLSVGGFAYRLIEDRGRLEQIRQTYYSKRALQAMRGRVEALRDRMRPDAYRGVMATVDQLIDITSGTGGRELGE